MNRDNTYLIGNKFSVGNGANNTSFKKGFIPWNKNKKGSQVAWNKDKKLSSEHIENLRKSHIGYVMPEEQKKKIKKNNARYWYGKKRPEMAKEKNPAWKGGITPIVEIIRKSLEMKLWRKANMERDNFTCQKCEIIGGKLQVHHINNFADFEELRTSISNGITFCKNCHKEFHKKYGVKNNTKGQLEEFLGIRLT